MVEEAAAHSRKFFDIGSKLAAIERKINSQFDQLKIIEEDSIEKHRETLKQIGDLKTDLIEFEKRVEELNNLVERSNARLNEFASKEKVKVLEKYINLWSPIKFITRPEVEALIEKKKAKKPKRRLRIRVKKSRS